MKYGSEIWAQPFLALMELVFNTERGVASSGEKGVQKTKWIYLLWVLTDRPGDNLNSFTGIALARYLSAPSSNDEKNETRPFFYRKRERKGYEVIILTNFSQGWSDKQEGGGGGEGRDEMLIDRMQILRIQTRYVKKCSWVIPMYGLNLIVVPNL